MRDGGTVVLLGVATSVAGDCRSALAGGSDDGVGDGVVVRDADGTTAPTAAPTDADVVLLGRDHPDPEGVGRRVDGGATPAVIRLVDGSAAPESAGGVAADGAADPQAVREASGSPPDATVATPIDATELRSTVRRLLARRTYEELVTAQYDALRQQALLCARQGPGEVAGGAEYGTLAAEIESLQERREQLGERLDHEDYRALFARLGDGTPPDGLDA